MFEYRGIPIYLDVSFLDFGGVWLWQHSSCGPVEGVGSFPMPFLRKPSDHPPGGHCRIASRVFPISHVGSFHPLFARERHLALGYHCSNNSGSSFHHLRSADGQLVEIVDEALRIFPGDRFNDVLVHVHVDICFDFFSAIFGNWALRIKEVANAIQCKSIKCLLNRSAFILVHNQLVFEQSISESAKFNQ